MGLMCLLHIRGMVNNIIWVREIVLVKNKEYISVRIASLFNILLEKVAKLQMKLETLSNNLSNIRAYVP